MPGRKAQIVSDQHLHVDRALYAVAAMIDQLVHHAEIISLKGDSFRLKDRRKEVTTD